MTKAFNYILKRWPSFTLFLEDGRVCLSNNAAERGLRGITLGRQSWLFCGYVNKVHHVTTSTKVAKDLGEDEDWLWDIAMEMEIKDGVIWVYGVGEDGVQAFTDFGIENLIELIRFYKENPGLFRR